MPCGGCDGEDAHEALRDVHMEWGVRIPLRDGVCLSGIQYRPVAAAAALPVICTLTPYVSQNYHDRGIYFAARGYIFIIVDVRGRGNSEGVFAANRSETRDAYDVIEWLAQQPFCNGKVAMWGGSYSGFVQWSAASERPPHLTSIVPVAAPFRGVDGPLRNNVFSTYRIQWLMLISGRTAQEKIFADQLFWNRQFCRWFESGTSFKNLDTFLGNPSATFQEWLAHPQVDGYWDAYNPTSQQYAQIDLPILTITGCYDVNQPGALTHYREHLKRASPNARSRHYLIIGPWDHAGTRTPKAEFAGLKLECSSLLDLSKLHAQWYGWTMQGGARPEFLKKNVAHYVMGAEKWRYADSLEAITSHTIALYMRSSGNPIDVLTSGSLAPEASIQNEPDRYTYDPRDCSLARVEQAIDPDDLVDQRMVVAAAGRHLVYHSAPFAEDVEISGFFKAQLWIAIDQPDTDFRVSVYEVAIDGTALRLTRDWLRARYREGLREQKLVNTDRPLPYDFEGFPFVSRRIRRGHRLRLIFGPLSSIHMEKNYNSGGVVAEETAAAARVVTVRLFHDEAHPSVVHVPIGQPEIDGSGTPRPPLDRP
jgi:uncharacterized protein